MSAVASEAPPAGASRPVTDLSLPVRMDSVATATPSADWRRAAARADRYVEVLGVAPPARNRLVRKALVRAASNPRWASGGRAMTETMLALHALLAAAEAIPGRNPGCHADYNHAPDVMTASAAARTRRWYHARRTDSSDPQPGNAAPLAFDHYGRLRLNSMPAMQRIHMLPSDLELRLLRRFKRLFARHRA